MQEKPVEVDEVEEQTMNQSIVKCLWTAACVAAVVSSSLAQSRPVEVRSYGGGGGAVARAVAPAAPGQQDPKPAPQRAEATDRVQLRLAEVMAMLEEDEMTPEQQLKALAKLTEVAERLKQMKQPAIVYRNFDGAVAVPSAPGAAPVPPMAPGEYPTRATVGRRVPAVEGDDKPARARALGVPMPPEPPAPPAPAKAPTPPVKGQVWRALTVPGTKAEAGTTTPRLMVSVSPDGREREIAVVEGTQVDNRKKRIEAALAKAEADVAKAKEEVARLQRMGREFTVEARRAKAEAERDKAEAMAKKAHDEARVAEERIRVVREQVIDTKAAPKARDRAPSTDEEIRATIEEMRAEMQEIRKLMQEIRARAQRESQRESQREAAPASIEVREVRGEPVQIREVRSGR
jgi:hypothetical protein